MILVTGHAAGTADDFERVVDAVLRKSSNGEEFDARTHAAARASFRDVIGVARAGSVEGRVRALYPTCGARSGR